jgi:hypothetical protein
MSEITVWKHWLSSRWHCAQAQRRDDRGDITQTVIIVALFAIGAIAICAIIIQKFTSKANSIPTE